MESEYTIQNTPIHPGEVLEFILEAWRLAPEEFSEKAGIDFEELRRLINCEIPISFGIAVKLSGFFGISIVSWLDLQKSYENEKRLGYHRRG